MFWNRMQSLVNIIHLVYALSWFLRLVQIPKKICKAHLTIDNFCSGKCARKEEKWCCQCHLHALSLLSAVFGKSIMGREMMKCYYSFWKVAQAACHRLNFMALKQDKFPSCEETFQWQVWNSSCLLLKMHPLQEGCRHLPEHLSIADCAWSSTGWQELKFNPVLLLRQALGSLYMWIYCFIENVMLEISKFHRQRFF